jgi:phospholipase C
MKKIALALSLALASCTGTSALSGGAANAPALPALRAAIRPHGNTPIQHVVVIVQENRSFDNLFAGFPGADAPMVGVNHKGKKVPLKAIPFTTTDINHGYGESLQDYDGGKMDGFSLNKTVGGKLAETLALSYVKRDLTAPYWSMAQQYTLADRMFPDEFGGSWTAHLDLIGTTMLSQTLAMADYPTNPPWNCNAPAGTKSTTVTPQDVEKPNGPFPCFTQIHTMADTLDAAGLSWRYYAPAVKAPGVPLGAEWSAFGEIKNVFYGPDWNNVVSPPTQILKDVAAGNLANVTWVIPEWQFSDHPGGKATTGPSWVASVVNAIGQSQFWNSTAIVVIWDDWGGFYDDAKPPHGYFDGLGIRVPCIIVSPYALAHNVSHTSYEFASINKFIEQTFGLPPLGPSKLYPDVRAASIADSFNFSQSPIPFTPISAPVPPSAFLKLVPDGKVPDDE